MKSFIVEEPKQPQCKEVYNFYKTEDAASQEQSC